MECAERDTTLSLSLKFTAVSSPPARVPRTHSLIALRLCVCVHRTLHNYNHPGLSVLRGPMAEMDSVVKSGLCNNSPLHCTNPLDREPQLDPSVRVVVVVVVGDLGDPGGSAGLIDVQSSSGLRRRSH